MNLSRMFLTMNFILCEMKAITLQKLQRRWARPLFTVPPERPPRRQLRTCGSTTSPTRTQQLRNSCNSSFITQRPCFTQLCNSSCLSGLFSRGCSPLHSDARSPCRLGMTFLLYNFQFLPTRFNNDNLQAFCIGANITPTTMEKKKNSYYYLKKICVLRSTMEKKSLEEFAFVEWLSP